MSGGDGATYEARKPWAASAAERARILRAAADHLEERRDEFRDVSRARQGTFGKAMFEISEPSTCCGQPRRQRADPRRGLLPTRTSSLTLRRPRMTIVAISPGLPAHLSMYKVAFPGDREPSAKPASETPVIRLESASCSREPGAGRPAERHTGRAACWAMHSSTIRAARSSVTGETTTGRRRLAVRST
jgi:acyl-CoA reductase-like NAD-dependent aldehyde dehydrogenase